MLHDKETVPVFWDGEFVAGGEPRWFQDAAADGIITRSGEGVGPCLFVKAVSSYAVVAPGDMLYRRSDGTIEVLTVASAVSLLKSVLPAVTHSASEAAA